MAVLQAQDSEANTEDSLFDKLGSRERIERVHRSFYAKIYADPELAILFKGTNQDHQISQQTEFMMRVFGGPKIYGGRLPKNAHEHLFITEEQFDKRHQMLADTLTECGVTGELKEKWLWYDASFKPLIVKKSIDECKKRFTMDEILFVPGTVTPIRSF
ncbi:MAG: group 1 truncated hemoglobin [Proteobacteria bacterium]|nr:group 1 truncated hemoglobin [Pseudomonadota bacterium]